MAKDRSGGGDWTSTAAPGLQQGPGPARAEQLPAGSRSLPPPVKSVAHGNLLDWGAGATLNYVGPSG